MGDKPRRDLGSLIKRFREAPPTSPSRRHEDELRPRSASPAPIVSTNYSDIVRNLRKSKDPLASGGASNNNHKSPATSYAGLGSLGGDDDFIAREIRQLKRDMHFNQRDRTRESLDSTDGGGGFKGLAMPDLRFSQDLNVDRAQVRTSATRQDILASSGTYSPSTSITGLGGYRFNRASGVGSNGDATLGNTGFKGLLMPDLMLGLDMDGPSARAAKKAAEADAGDRGSHTTIDDSKVTDLGEYKLTSGDISDADKKGDVKGVNGALDGLLKHLHAQQAAIEERLNAPPGSSDGTSSGASGSGKNYSTSSNFGEFNSISLIATKLENDLHGCFQHYADKPEPVDKEEQKAREEELVEQGRREERERFLLSVTGLIPTPPNPGTGADSKYASSAGLGLSDSEAEGEDLHIIRTMHRHPGQSSRDVSPSLSHNHHHKHSSRAGLHPYYDRPRNDNESDDDDSIGTLRTSIFGAGGRSRKKLDDPLDYHNPKDFRRPKAAYYSEIHGGPVEQSDAGSNGGGNYNHGTGYAADVNPLEYGARRRFQTPLPKDRHRSRSSSPSIGGGGSGADGVASSPGIGTQTSHPGTPASDSNHNSRSNLHDREPYSPYRPYYNDSKPGFVPDIINTNSLTSTSKKINSSLTSAMDALALRLPDPALIKKDAGKGNAAKGKADNAKLTAAAATTDKPGALAVVKSTAAAIADGAVKDAAAKGVSFADTPTDGKTKDSTSVSGSGGDVSATKSPLTAKFPAAVSSSNTSGNKSPKPSFDESKAAESDKKRRSELDSLDKTLGPVATATGTGTGANDAYRGFGSTLSGLTRGIGEPMPPNYGKQLFDNSVPPSKKFSGVKPKDLPTLEKAASQYLQTHQREAAAALNPVVAPVPTSNYRFSEHPFTNSLTPDSAKRLKDIDIDNSAVEAELGGDAEPSAPPLPVGPRRTLPSPGYMSPSSPMINGVAGGGSGIDFDGSVLYNYSPSSVATAHSAHTPFKGLPPSVGYDFPRNPAVEGSNQGGVRVGAEGDSGDNSKFKMPPASERPAPLGTSPSSLSYVYGDNGTGVSAQQANTEQVYSTQDPYPSIDAAAYRQAQRAAFEHYQTQQQLLMQSRDHSYASSRPDVKYSHGTSVAGPISLSQNNISDAHSLYANHNLPRNLQSAHISNQYGFDDLLVLPSSRKAVEGQALHLLHSGQIDPSYTPPPHPSSIRDNNASSSSSSRSEDSQWGRYNNSNYSSEILPVQRNIYDVRTVGNTGEDVAFSTPTVMPESQYERERFLEHMQLRRASYASLLL